ncbi:r3H domain protein [Coprococcus sp. CAG:782]|mgnify:FL=1|uniref:RNA-binding cell elongation regulator Jag/EloR n=1 Tax=Coprococcus sp. OM04-5BH TaxID=2293093 RepID=UPI000335A538|nr:RNA-binding cell elongation regulator Jag/EloR [Coprococcus sp. OM04-5BH]RHV34098.1 protein jag [Coprococcus sp. OM04-5BH]CCY53935.1 r3H domain protein [Coprococcus sp. CAG:782]
MEFVEFKAKTKDEALTNASLEFGCPIESIEYEVVSEASKGFIGIGAKPCIIKARKKKTFVDEIKEYIASMLDAMGIEAKINIDYDDIEGEMNIDLEGSDMGILIGKRGQTLDALQYLIRLAVNKKSESYIKVKLDTENYRARRKETLENLAKNIAFKVKRTKRSFALEPMNPYERRIIHSTLQNDKYVATKSEGEEPYRKVIVYLKKYDRR